MPRELQRTHVIAGVCAYVYARARVCVVPSRALQRSERQSDTSVRVIRDCRVNSRRVYAIRSERSTRRSIVRPLTVSRELRASPKRTGISGRVYAARSRRSISPRRLAVIRLPTAPIDEIESRGAFRSNAVRSGRSRRVRINGPRRAVGGAPSSTVTPRFKLHRDLRDRRRSASTFRRSSAERCRCARATYGRCRACCATYPVHSAVRQ